MTYQECIRFIRILLDSDHEYYCNIQMVESAVNECQSNLLNILHISGDERGLRTSYDFSYYNTPTNVVTGILNAVVSANTVRYPKGLSVSIVQPSVPPSTVQLFAQYLPYNTFINLPIRTGGYMASAGSRFPASLYWTYNHTYTAATDSQDVIVQFTADTTQPTVTAEMSYIKEPAIFSPTQPLVLPLEYHHIVCLLAAELLNTIDVEELQRGQGIDVRQGMKQAFNDLGLI